MSDVETDDGVELSTNSPENRQIFDWIESLIGSHFKSSSGDNPRQFSLLEFELGKDEPNEDDLLRCNLGEGMVIPLRVVYKLDDTTTSSQLVMKLPTYFFDYAEEINNDMIPTINTIHTHETYFYSVVMKDIEDFIRSENADLTLAIPECFYVKHMPKYDMRKTPALIDNLMEAKTLLILADPKSSGYTEPESVEEIDLHEGLAVMTEIAKLHAVTWSMQEKRGQMLNDMWKDLLSVTDQEAINDQVIEGSFEFFSTGFDDEEGDDHNLYAQLLFNRTKIEKIVRETLYAAGPKIPNSLLHMMIGGPHLFFRRDYEQSPGCKSDVHYNEATECCIGSWSLATIGNPVLDLALFSCVSLLPEVRRRYNHAFLEQYWQVFVCTASKFKLEPPFNFDYICKEFEKFQIWCMLFIVAACKQDNMRVEEMRDIIVNILDLLPSLSTDDLHTTENTFTVH